MSHFTLFFFTLDLNIPFEDAFAVNPSAQLLIDGICPVSFCGIDTYNPALTAGTRCVKIVENPDSWFTAD